jgi:ribosomal protein S18 acetylase RimI-like enzyme
MEEYFKVLWQFHQRNLISYKAMKLRRFKKEDWKAINTIYNLSKPDEMRGSVDLRALIPIEEDEKGIALFNDSQIFVAEENETILGFGGHKANYISWLFVHPDHRRRRVAHMIIDHILSKLTGTIKLNVGKHNKAAKSLYAKYGFKIEREFTGNFNGYKSEALTMSLYKAT